MGKYHEDLALRLLDIKLINDEWQDLTEIYGTEVATELRKIAPSDPSILYDLSVISLMDDGVAEEQAIKIVDNHSTKDWQKELEGAKPIIVNTIRRAKAEKENYLKTKQKRLSEKLPIVIMTDYKEKTNQ